MLFASIFVCSALVGLATAAVGGPSFSNEPSGTRALATAKNIPTVELEALRTLYDATNGPHWRWFYLNVTQGVAWNFSGDPNPCVDFWQGIRCTEELVEPYVHVSAIILSAHELSGTLPASIDSFSHIAFLDLGFNQLHGGIPASIGNLTSLRALVLSGNEWACSLEGWLGRLDQLLLFECNLCRLHGHLPSLSGMSLVELQLRGNNITGSLVPIGDLENMRILRINDNQFTGNIPATFTNLTLLTTLDLHHNRLSGPLPAVGWAAMQSLSLQANFLTGPIPALANASSLYFVDLSQNR
ncbi:hypothetical protein B484DRAFT_341646 [Ochromonadaceae sp. CCMP2298]|nr:hypothetical protein B484DRAFT_341646 [Ochromonadaceae sp. CCMP2298]